MGLYVSNLIAVLKPTNNEIVIMTIYLDMVPNKKASILRYKYRQTF